MSTLLAAFACVAIASVPALAAWPTSPTVNVPVCTAPSYQLQPCVTSDGAGGAIVAWVDFRGFSTVPSANGIYAQHILVSGAVDPAWPANGIQLWSGVGWLPKLVSDGAGGAIVTWTDWTGGTDDNIRAHHVRADGTLDPAWPAAGVGVCTAPGNQDSDSGGWTYQLAASDGAGGILVAWDDARGGGWDVYAQRVLASGVIAPGWPANGLALCTATGDQLHPALMADGSGGALVCWEDHRGGSSYRTYAQHALASGSIDPAWTANGNLVSDAFGWRPSLVTDGGTGAIVAQRAEPYSVRAQHLRIDGTADPAWPVGGRKISWRDSTLIGYSHGPVRLVADGAGGAFLAWLEIPAMSPGWFVVGEGAVNAAGDLMISMSAGGVAYIDGPYDGGDGIAIDQPGIALAASGTGVEMVQAVYPYFAATPINLAAERFFKNGTTYPAWGAETGPMVSIAPGRQLCPDVVADGFGGVIAVWQDTRADSSHGNDDIYAQRIGPGGQLAGVGDPPAITPNTLALAAPAPNPASRATTLRFALPAAARVSLRVYDTAGRLVRTLADGARGAGEHASTWDLRDERGRNVGAGLYFARLDVNGRTLVRRIAVTP